MIESLDGICPVIVRDANPQRVPDLIEVPILEDVRPYMVSGPRNFVWVAREGRNVARTSLMPFASRQDAYRAILQEVREVAEKQQWGSVHPLSHKGIQAAIDHVASYGYTPDVLVHQSLVDSGAVDPIEVVAVDWLPPATVLVVPTDRNLVGHIQVFGSHYSVVIFDPSRAFGIACADGLADATPADPDSGSVQ